MAHPFKKVADDILEALLESGPRIGRSLRERSDAQARKIRDDIDAIRAKDRDLAARQRTQDTDVDRPRSSDPHPEHAARPVGPVQPLDVDTYEGLHRRAVVGDQLEHDHVPSAAALIREAEIEKDGPLTDAERRAVYADAASIELPSTVHRATRTYGGRNTQAQIAEDAADLAAAAGRDYTDRIALLLHEGVPLDEIETAIRNLMAMNRERGIG